MNRLFATLLFLLNCILYATGQDEGYDEPNIPGEGGESGEGGGMPMTSSIPLSFSTTSTGDSDKKDLKWLADYIENHLVYSAIAAGIVILCCVCVCCHCCKRRKRAKQQHPPQYSYYTR